MRRFALLSVMVLAVLTVTACGTSPSVATPDAVVQTAAANGTAVDVSLADYTITSSQTTFQAGITYTFVIKNDGRHSHNFSINTPASIAGSLEAAYTSAILLVDQAQLSVGATAVVQFTFPDSAAGVPLEFSCLIENHYEAGMTLPITVTQ